MSNGPIRRDSRAVPIREVRALRVELPTIRPHHLSMTTMRTQTLVLVQVVCDDGVIGIGEGTTIGGLSYGPESPEGIQLTIQRYLAPLLIGRDAQEVRPAISTMAQRVRGNHFARAAVETALWDAQGQRLGLPVSELLGGRMRSSMPVAWTLASGDTGRDIAEAEEMLAKRRHRDFKLKIGARPVREDLAHVSAIARALEGRATIRVDVNQAWDEITARFGMAALQDAGVHLVEQPVSVARPEALARLSALFTVPVMADESLQGPVDAFSLAKAGAANVFAVKVASSGGLLAALHVAGIAAAAGVGLYGGTMLEGGVGTAAAAQVCSTFERLDFGTELFGPLLLTEELLETPLEYRDFELHIPEGPGLGIRLDQERVERFRVDA